MQGKFLQRVAKKVGPCYRKVKVDLAGKKIFVLGLEEQALSLIRFLVSQKAHVTAFDKVSEAAALEKVL